MFEGVLKRGKKGQKKKRKKKERVLHQKPRRTRGVRKNKKGKKKRGGKKHFATFSALFVKEKRFRERGRLGKKEKEKKNFLQLLDPYLTFIYAWNPWKFLEKKTKEKGSKEERKEKNPFCQRSNANLGRRGGSKMKKKMEKKKEERRGRKLRAYTSRALGRANVEEGGRAEKEKKKKEITHSALFTSAK